MRKKVWVFGLIAGFISIAWIIFLPLVGNEISFDSVEIIGFATMLLAFSLIVVAVKTYRDQNSGGYITFGKAFRIGLWMSLIASSIYVITWLIYYYSSDTNFLEAYSAHYLEQLKADGVSPEKIAAEAAEMQQFGRLYNDNPIVNALVTYLEILPVGLLVSLIAALILKRKQKPVIQ